MNDIENLIKDVLKSFGTRMQSELYNLSVEYGASKKSYFQFNVKLTHASIEGLQIDMLIQKKCAIKNITYDMGRKILDNNITPTTSEVSEFIVLSEEVYQALKTLDLTEKE